MDSGTHIVEPNDTTSVAIANRKLLGVYPQKQAEFYMQRIKIFGGRISWSQWRTIARCAARYSPHTPLHLTTRQDIEFHNLSANDLPSLQEELSAVGLSTFGAGGDSVRNITVCTDCKFGGDINVYELARNVRDHLGSLPIFASLPRKFKISFSACQKACAKPFINDLAFTAQSNGLLTAVGAGSLGPKPATGIELYKNLSAADVIPLCQAAIEFFNEHGDRQNRRKARLRHVRQRLGNEAFRQELDGRFKTLREKRNNQSIAIESVNHELNRLLKLQLPNGDIAAEDALSLADCAEPLNLELRINLSHGLELYGSSGFDLRLPSQLTVLTDRPAIVACPGCKTCTNAITDCCATADKLRDALKNIKSEKYIHLSGCPNDCAQCAVADIGFIGMIRTIDGVRQQCYRVLKKGESGTTAKLAQETAVIAADAVPDYVKTIV